MGASVKIFIQMEAEWGFEGEREGVEELNS